MRYVYITLLDGSGFQIFSINKRRIIKTVKPGRDSNKHGFVEGLFVPEINAYFVSQMSTGRIYEYDVSDCSNPIPRREINTKGRWSKVIAYNNKLNMIAVSNWLSSDVSIIDYKTGCVVKQIDELSEPRGIVFSDDGKFLYIASFKGNTVAKYRTSDWVKASEIAVVNSAMRHLQLTDDDSTLYASSMALGRVYKIDYETI